MAASERAHTFFELPASGRPLSRARIEVLFSRLVAASGLFFGLQIIPSILDGERYMRQPVGYIAMSLYIAGLVWMGVAAVIQRDVKLSYGAFATVYLLGLACWPLMVSDPSTPAPVIPWLWYVSSFVGGWASLAFPTGVAVVYALVTPVVYGVVRMLPAGGGATLTAALLDSLYSVILAGAILAMFIVLRQASNEVDLAQGAALKRYGVAVRAQARETERVKVDAIVHDSVLATLLAAASANTPEQRRLATQMATAALGHLDGAPGAPPDGGAPVDVTQLGERITVAAQAFPAPIEVSIRGVIPEDAPVERREAGQLIIPADVAEALFSATVQAMVNSVQHAGNAAHRSVLISDDASGEIRIEILDDGNGFDPLAIARERLGVRVSIRERLTWVGGTAVVRSALGKGTTVSLRWPVDDGSEWGAIRESGWFAEQSTGQTAGGGTA